MIHPILAALAAWALALAAVLFAIDVLFALLSGNPSWFSTVTGS